MNELEFWRWAFVCYVGLDFLQMLLWKRPRR